MSSTTEELNDKLKQDLKIDEEKSNDKETSTTDEIKIQEIKLKDKYKTNNDDLKEANNLKVLGNKAYTAAEYQNAINYYTEAISILKKEDDDNNNNNNNDNDTTNNDSDNEDNNNNNNNENINKTKKVNKIIEIRENTEEDIIACFEELSILYSNRSACYLSIKQYDSVIKDCNIALEFEPTPTTIKIKIYHRRAQAREQLNKLKESLEDYQEIIKLDPSFPQAQQALKRLPPKIKEKEDKEREEMMGKLKDLGNTILGKFGMSTDNFQFVKDPNTGGYSVNFKK
ncbi:hypothetical protein ACTFIW_001513 [Dictyostelium discoideum]